MFIVIVSDLKKIKLLIIREICYKINAEIR